MPYQTRAQRFFAAQTPSAGVPAGNQVLVCLRQCSRTPQNHYGNPNFGALGLLGSGKTKKIAKVDETLKRLKIAVNRQSHQKVDWDAKNSVPNDCGNQLRLTTKIVYQIVVGINSG